ncbi:hypothetical protein FG05_30173 [Fusarium graminearum]|nr:hypothetical protein FG05_30173 [Fusarium graminearum]
MRTRLKSPDLYAIGWIAALPIERAAATALLHDRHDAPEGFDQHQSDTNSYTWGRIGEHNVVIASLPAGVYGITSAATTALNLIHSLPHIRIGLLVGIGGGIARPDEGQDIRLGDIVVSQPDGTTGGVVQYDLGKTKANGGWERKGSLDKPPPVLLHALASLQAEHEIEPSKVPDLLQAMLEANPGMTRPKRDFTYQGAENDRLFHSKYDHVGGSNCDKCDSTLEVERDQRESPDPEIHYGIIASGNKLIKDAATRDSLFADTGHQCLCVEMEAAGLMDRFPCLVIRGVCDYADSHKNDRWQRYAAATAAAFAVELLEYVPAAQLEATQKVIKAIQTLELKVDSLSVPIQKVDYRTAFDQLPVAEGASFNSKAEEHNPTCLPNTREELLKEIDRWIDDPTSKTIFWLNGMAGTGKSTISRTVAHLRSKRGDLGANFFFKRGEMDRGNLNKLMSTLAYQLAFSIQGAAFFIKKTLDDNPAIVGKSTREQFQKLIQEPLSDAAAVAKAMSSVVIVIDALDECDQEADIRLLIHIFSQAKTLRPHLRVFLTSRPELPIRLGFNEVQGSYQDLVLHEIPAQIVKHDIVVFLDNEFKKIRHDFNMTVCNERKLPPDWPGCLVVQSLAQMAVPLFIFAATITGKMAGEGHSSSVSSVVFSHDSKKVASSSDDKTIRIWNAETGECERELKGHSGRVCSVVFSHDSKKVASSSSKTIRIWDAETGECEQVLEGHSDEVRTVVFSHDSKKVASSSNDMTIRIWDAETGECERVLDGDSDVRSVVFSHDSKKVASGSYDNTIWIWDAETGECEQVLEGHSDDIRSVVFSHDSKKVASGSDDNTIRIWNAKIGKCERVLEGHSDWVNSVVFSHDSKKVASASNDKTIRIWDTETGKCERVLEGHSDEVNSVVFSHDSKKVASGSNDDTICIWNAETGECERVLEGHSDEVNSVVFSHDSKKVASSSNDMTIRIWDTERGKCERVLEGHSHYVNSVVFSHDSKKVASASYDKTIRIWDAKMGKCEQELKGHSRWVKSVVFSHDSKKVASGSGDKTIRIWNAKTGECEQVLEGHSDYVRSVVFSHDSKKVASASNDKTIRIWNAETGECERVLEGHSDYIRSVVFSHDSKKVASGSYDNTIWIWDAETGECGDVILMHGYAGVLSFTLNGRSIITDCGTFPLTCGSQSRPGSAMPWQSSHTPVLACTDSTWVTAAGRDFLWLPPECRNGNVAVSGSRVAIGCRSGRVLVLGISMTDVEQWMDTTTEKMRAY